DTPTPEAASPSEDALEATEPSVDTHEAAADAGSPAKRTIGTRSAALPSQSGGGSEGAAPGAASAAGMPAIAAGSSPSRVLVPARIVTGRSVLARRVKQGTPRYVVSSWMPPESVRTAAASARSDRNSM